MEEKIKANIENMKQYQSVDMVAVCEQGCEGEYSANPGDYFWLGDVTMICEGCGSDLCLVEKKRGCENRVSPVLKNRTLL